MILGSIIGGGASLLGGLFGGKGGADIEKMMREQMEIAARSFSPINMGGMLGGGGITFTPAAGGGISGINLQASPFQQAMFGGLSDYGTQLMGMLGQDFGFNPLQQQAVGMLQGMDPMTGPLEQVQGLLGDQLGAIQGMDDFWGGMGRDFATQGADILSGMGSFADYQGDTLAMMREQARPAEERAGANMLERLFGSGAGATTGGARNAAEFSRGLEQADIDRQLASYGEARARMGSDLARGQGLMGLGQGMAGFQDQLMGNALSRFGGLANMASQMGAQRFQQQAGLADALFGMGQAQMQQPLQMQSQVMGGLSNVFGGQNMLMNQQTQNLSTLLNFMTNQANARNAQAGQAANLANLAGANEAGWGQTLTQIGGAIGGDNPLSGLGDWLDKIF